MATRRTMKRAAKKTAKRIVKRRPKPLSEVDRVGAALYSFWMGQLSRDLSADDNVKRAPELWRQCGAKPTWRAHARTVLGV